MEEFDLPCPVCGDQVGRILWNEYDGYWASHWIAGQQAPGLCKLEPIEAARLAYELNTPTEEAQ